MPDEEAVVETGEEQTGESSVVIDTSKTDDEEKGEEKTDAVQGGSEEAEELPEEDSEESDEGEEDGEKEERIDFSAELEKMKAELRAEREPVKKEDEKKIYTKDELRNYRRQVEQKKEDGEINNAQYLAYIEQIEDLNEERIRHELGRETERRTSRVRAEENVTAWAEANAPELLDGRTKASKDSIGFAKRELGAQLENGNWIIPETVGRVLFGLAKGTQDPKAKETEAEERGRQKALKEKQVRDRDLKTGDKPPSGKTPSKKAGKQLSQIDEDVRRRLDLSPSAMKVYKRLKGHSDVEILDDGR